MNKLLLAALFLSLSAQAAPKDPAIGLYEVKCAIQKAPDLSTNMLFYPSIVSKKSSTKYLGFQDGKYSMGDIPYVKMGSVLCTERNSEDDYSLSPIFCLRSNIAPNKLIKNAAYVLLEAIPPDCHDVGGITTCVGFPRRTTYLCDVIKKSLPASQP